jgi:putative restriction endonuclease
VPKTSVNKNRDTLLTEDEVRTAGKPRPAAPSGDLRSPEQLDESQFRAAISVRTDFGHYPRSRSRCEDVSHDSCLEHHRCTDSPLLVVSLKESARCLREDGLRQRDSGRLRLDGIALGAIGSSAGCDRSLRERSAVASTKSPVILNLAASLEAAAPAMETDDARLRVAALNRVRELAAIYGDAIPWGEIARGFVVDGEDVFLSGKARGIFRPRRMSRGVLSIKTTMPRAGRERRYNDIASDDGFFEYRFMGDDPAHSDNRSMREAWEDQTPFIYFHAVAPTFYEAIMPAFISEWNPQALTVHVVPGELQADSVATPVPIDARRYAVLAAKQRLHQAMFREDVLEAYSDRCAITGLPEKRLLHAAHILPDKDQRGLPIISNGIAMTVLHHSAYDANLLGIDSDGKIHINRGLLEMHDGPTLRHALQNIHGTVIRKPTRQTDHPNRDYLAARFERFAQAA